MSNPDESGASIYYEVRDDSFPGGAPSFGLMRRNSVGGRRVTAYTTKEDADAVAAFLNRYADQETD